MSDANLEWITCLTGQFGDSIGGGAGQDLYFQFADNPSPANAPLIQIPFDCTIIGFGVSYLSAASSPLVFTSGELEFRLGQIRTGQPAVGASFEPFPVPGNVPQISWGAAENNTHPTTIVSSLNIDLPAGTLLCAQSLETGVIAPTPSSSEVSGTIWLRGNTPKANLPAGSD